ncbi:MAG TPA: MerR family transcriptional regulator [Terriglobia bacterium]|nr:MerR family transcriptional regulator [Terriglobia bacterium]
MPKGLRSNARHASHAPSAEINIPDRLYFRIGEVSELIAIKAYVLRYWESEFPMLKPVKNSAGRRLYRRQDLEIAIEIKRLLYEKGYTIEGARKQLANPREPEAAASAIPKGARSEGALDAQHLRAIKRELEGILTILSSKC